VCFCFVVQTKKEALALTIGQNPEGRIECGFDNNKKQKQGWPRPRP
jgi:hypothetical protein